MSQNRDGIKGGRTFCQIRRLFEVLRSIDLLGEATVSAVHNHLVREIGMTISHRTVARDFDVLEIACLIECIGVSIKPDPRRFRALVRIHDLDEKGIE